MDKNQSAIPQEKVNKTSVFTESKTIEKKTVKLEPKIEAKKIEEVNLTQVKPIQTLKSSSDKKVEPPKMI